MNRTDRQQQKDVTRSREKRRQIIEYNGTRYEHVRSCTGRGFQSVKKHNRQHE